MDKVLGTHKPARHRGLRGGLRAEGGCDLGGVAGDGLADQVRGEAAPVDLGEDAVQVQRLGGVEQLVGDLAAGADHDRPVAAGAGLERGGTDDEAAPAGSLGTQVLMVVGVDGAGLGRVGARVEVGGEGHLENRAS